MVGQRGRIGRHLMQTGDGTESGEWGQRGHRSASRMGHRHVRLRLLGWRLTCRSGTGIDAHALS